MRCWRLVWAMVVVVGCGDGMSEMDAGRDAGATRSDAGRDAGATRDGGRDAGEPDDDAGSDAGASDAGTDAAMTVDAAGARIALSDVAVYANCMPIVPPDPILAFWTVTITDAPASSATLTSAQLTITSAATTVTQNLTVDSPTVALSGGSGSAMQRKTGADSNPTGACSTLCAGATYTLTLTYDVGGTSIEVVQTDSFGCVY